jgi:SHS2 domain-containing protein
VRQPGYEVLEHTADAGIIAHGRTLEEAFVHAAEGMYSLMVDLDTVRETAVRDVEAAGAGRTRLLSKWLLELLFLTETEGLLFRRFEVHIDDGTLRCRAHGEPLDPERHALGAAIKGVTRHMMEVEEEDGGVRVRVLFDI